MYDSHSFLILKKKKKKKNSFGLRMFLIDQNGFKYMQ